MKRFFTNEDFEDFLKTSTDRFQMRPSEKVWKAISDDLNRKRRRIAWFTGLFLVAVSGMEWWLANHSPAKLAEQPVSRDNIYRSQVAEANASNSPAISSTRVQDELVITGGTAISSGSQSLPSTVKPKSTRRNSLFIAYKKPVQKNNDQIPEEAVAIASEKQSVAEDASNNYLQTIVDSDPEHQPADFTQTELVKLPEQLSIESITNSFKSAGKKSKLNFELFFTPTISYRKLSENKEYMQHAEPAANSGTGIQALYNINDAVTHKPNIGLELGVVTKYPVSDNIRLKGGVQFNMSRYDIKAFTSYSEVATMAFRDGNTTMSASNKRNLGGTDPDWLQNVYYQVSAPVGLEVKIGRKDKTQFGFAGTFQPTYMIGDRAYLISTDYKNYVEVPWLVRRWNMNTALETFVSYSTGKMNWQVGPQVRYQLLSSFISNYPVKENLFDFGLKIGVSLNKSETNRSKD